jgi:hypothetical protein
MSLYHHALSWTFVADPQTYPRVVEVPDEDAGDEPLRWYVVAAYMTLVIAGFALAGWLTASWYGDCHSNSSTGRATSYAGDSLRGSLCHSGHGAAGLLVPGAWVVGLALATLALARWGGSRLRVLLLAILFVAPAALPPAAYAGLGESSKECTGQKLADYRAWVDHGSKGTSPYDCRTF